MLSSLLSCKHARAGLAIVAGGGLLLAARRMASRTMSSKPHYLKEFSVVYTERAVNLMSSPFQETMRTVNTTLKKAYNADAVVLIPGSGTYGMEAVARVFATGKKVVVMRNGWFSYRWTEILDACQLGAEDTVMKAKPTDSSSNPQIAPTPEDEFVKTIKTTRPAAVFAPHVETSTGVILSDSYIKAVGAACKEVGAVFVLDCIASGTVWIDMKGLGVDVVISAPQKGWSAPASVGLVMLSERAAKMVRSSPPTFSYAVNLPQWLSVMDEYARGAFKYYTTLPTDAIMQFCDAMKETESYGFEKAREDLLVLGKRIRAMLAEKGYPSVAAKGFEAPGVVVVYTDSASAVADFKAQDIQVAGGVPWMLDEPKGLLTFRIGLFGLDKIADIDRTVKTLADAVDAINAKKAK